MAPVTVLAAISGAVLVGGLVLLAAAFLPGPPPGTAGPPGWLVAAARRAWHGPGRTLAQRRRYRLATAASLACGLVMWRASGLPMLGLVAAVAVPGVPWLLGAAGAERRAIARIEAIGEWTRRLRDVAGTGTGLQAAIISAAATAPPAIAEQVAMLAARLQAGQNAHQALRGFADEIDDPLADQVVAALTLHLRDRGDRLGAVLTSIADATAKEVAMRNDTDAERASARLSIRFMVGFTILVVAVAGLAGDYMTPYATPAGQVVMAVLAAGFIGLLLWVRAMSRPAATPRLLHTPPSGVGP